MQVFVQTEEDWIDFCNGVTITAKLTASSNYYKRILVAFNEIVATIGENVQIIRKY